MSCKSICLAACLPSAIAVTTNDWPYLQSGKKKTFFNNIVSQVLKRCSHICEQAFIILPFLKAVEIIANGKYGELVTRLASKPQNNMVAVIFFATRTYIWFIDSPPSWYTENLPFAMASAGFNEYTTQLRKICNFASNIELRFNMSNSFRLSSPRRSKYILTSEI